MRTLVIGVALAFASVASLAAQPGSKTPDEFDAKQKALREEIEQLQKKLNALKKQQQELFDKKNQAQIEAQRKELERKQKEEAEKKAKEEAEAKKHFAKVEIRGKLVKAGPGQYQVKINELKWTLNFGDKKQLAASAEKLLGKGVVITGVVVNKKPPNLFGYGYPINPGWPNPNPGWPNQNPGGWNPYPFYVETPVTITVESLTAAKD